jgi:chromate reductase, NAD(P)H dehydrogenase (quinone)
MPDTTLPRLIGMSGSLRSGSYSNAVLETLREKFAGRADLRIYDLRPIPLYDQDFEGEKRPEPVKALLSAIAESDGLVLCAPEFNHSIPGVLKNALDWASRPAFTSVMAYKPVAIMATSRGALGGARCLEHMRVALESMLSRVVLAREVTITSSADKIRDGRLVDKPSLDFACAAVEALLKEIRLWRMAESFKD